MPYYYGTSTPLADNTPPPPAILCQCMLWTSVRAAGRRCRWRILQDIVCCVEKHGRRWQRVIIYAHVMLGSRTQQINANHSANSFMIYEGDMRNVETLLNGRMVPFDSLLRPNTWARTMLLTMLLLYLMVFRRSVPSTAPPNDQRNNYLRFAAELAIHKRRLQSYHWLCNSFGGDEYAINNTCWEVHEAI